MDLFEECHIRQLRFPFKNKWLLFGICGFEYGLQMVYTAYKILEYHS